MTNAIRVGVVGAEGRMGSETCRAIDADDELKLVAKVGRADSLEVLVESGAEVAVDFTTPEAVRDNVSFVLEHGIHAVVGATGLSKKDIEDLSQGARGGTAQLFVAPNFAMGAVLMMRFAAEAAPLFDTAEIVERHHEKKVDAPSGTSLRTAELMNEARGAPWLAGATGQRDSRGEPRRRCVRHPGALDPERGLGRPSGSHPGVGGRDPEHPPRLAGSSFVHAGGAAGDQEGVTAEWPHRRSRASARSLR